MTALPSPPAPPAPLTTPLGPDDFDAQDAALDALRELSEEIPQWEFCEGFLAGLVCARRAIAPEEYWPVLLSDDFNPVAHMEFVWRWRRRWAEVATALDEPVETLDDDRTYQPEVLDTRGALLALPEAQRGETDLAALPAFAQVWALGFMYAVETWPDDWLAPRDPDAAQMLDSALSACDVLVVTVLRRLNGSVLLGRYPNLTAYITRSEARPAYKRAFDAQLAVFTGKTAAE